MTNDITSKLNSSTPEMSKPIEKYKYDFNKSGYENTYELMKEMPNEFLIEEAQDFKYANWYIKLNRFLLPVDGGNSKEASRQILKEKGIDYRIKEQEYNLRKEKNKKEWKALGNFIQEINPFKILYSLLNKYPPTY